MDGRLSLRYAFTAAWRRLARRARCDELGSAEYRRCREELLALAELPQGVTMDEWIIAAANRPPTAPDSAERKGGGNV